MQSNLISEDTQKENIKFIKNDSKMYNYQATKHDTSRDNWATNHANNEEFFLLSALFSFICINIELYNWGTMCSDLKKIRFIMIIVGIDQRPDMGQKDVELGRLLWRGGKPLG